LSNQRRGVAFTFCDGGVAATGNPISVFGVKALFQCGSTDRIRLVNTGHQTAGRNRNSAPRIPARPVRRGGILLAF
jgi:hypothetical protein